MPSTEGANRKGRLKIAIDARHLRDFGIGTHIRNLIENLPAAAPDLEFQALVRGADQKDLPSGIHPVLYEQTDQDRFEDIRFPMALRALKADLYHIPLNAVAMFMPKPYVVTIHDMSSLLYPDGRGMDANWRAYRFRRGLQRADRVIAVSHATKRDVQRVMGVPESRIRVIHNAPDPVFTRSDVADDLRLRELLVERYQVDFPYILYAGTIRAQKNVPRLVEAFAVLRGELESHPIYKKLRLVIIGDEVSKHPQLRRTVIQSRVENLVRFLGFVPIDMLRAFYKNAAAFVFPSLYEGFGLPPIEAMACGTPVVASNVSSLPEVVGDAAIVVNPENVFDISRGIREVLLDEFLRRRCVQLGLQQLKRFSWMQTAEQTARVYREVTGLPDIEIPHIPR
ncbi:MAG: glycosyltransferase family 4 protein [Acidobacteria bacterium]|nr:glycosyltransferase family 4 protein [Acidobacteriota bacterium]